MRRTTIVLPDWFDLDQESPFRERLPTLNALAELGSLVRIPALPPSETPEAFWLGLAPGEGQLRQGPLTVAALGADPPDRSTHFHLSLLGLVDGVAVQPPVEVPPEDLSLVLELAKKLDTKSLTFVAGEHLDHGLVWEGLGDHCTVPVADLFGNPLEGRLPEGDAETTLRRFVDDSINILSELEFNQRRRDEGVPPLNLLWPWGEGVRKAVPNLLLRRGERVGVESGSLRLEGLTKLVGYRHGNRSAFGRGVGVRLEHLAMAALKSASPKIVVIGKPAGEEEARWFARQLDERLLKPLFDSAVRDRSRVAVVSPGDSVGLGISFETGNAGNNPYPFDDRSLDETRVPVQDAWEWIARSLAPLGAPYTEPNGAVSRPQVV